MLNVADKELAAVRHERIAQIVRQKRVVKVSELCRDLLASPATIRRDLVEMEKLGRLGRVHGGAVSTDSRFDEPQFEDKAILAAGEKQRIAKAAEEYIKQGDSIFLDGGSTVLGLAGLIQNKTGISVVTNSLRVASTLSAEGPSMIMVGGEFRRLSQTFVGSLTKPFIDQIHVDTAFMGTIGLSMKDGMTTTDPREAHTKELVLSNARQVILLADSSKIGKVSFVKFGSLDNVDVLITDDGISHDELNKFKKNGINVIVV